MADLAGDERGAFRKMVEGLNVAQEGAMELGVRLSDGRWAVVATKIQEMTQAINMLRAKSASGMH